MSKKNNTIDDHAGSSVSRVFKEMPSDYSIRLFPNMTISIYPLLQPPPMPSWEDTFGKLIKYLVTEKIVISLFKGRLFFCSYFLFGFLESHNITGITNHAHNIYIVYSYTQI